MTAIPIIALTVRPASDTVARSEKDRKKTDAAIGAGDVAEPEIEGVFRVSGDRVTFVPVKVGIAGDEYFEVVSGVAPGDTLVAGPYTAIRQLRAGDQVRRLEDAPPT